MKNKYLTAIFLLAAIPAFAGDVTLTCTDPTQNEDGSPLTDLAGIKVYEGSASGGPYTEVLDVANCAAIPTIVRPPGTYYYVGTAYNTSNVESVYSNEATKTVPIPTPNPPSGLSVL